MEPKFQTSFIPKAPMMPQGNQSGYTSGSSFNILKTFSIIIFILAILVSGGLFAYEMQIKRNIEAAKVALVEAKAAFDSPDNQKVILVSNQLKSIQDLLNRHVVLSPLFELLEQQTLSTVKLSDFEFEREGNTVLVTIKAEAQSYASLAQQSKLFSEAVYLSNFNFSQMLLTERGTIETTFTAVVNPELLMYTKQLQAVSLMNQVQ